MTNNVTPFVPGKISKHFANRPLDSELSAGISTSYPIIRHKGKVWSISYRGTTKSLMREDGDGPRNSIDVIIVSAARNLSKTFYLNGYIDGANSAPDCFSNNGVTPEETSKVKQSVTCATCERNKWGATVSAVTGRPAKECQDSKRLAVLPLWDIANEEFGGGPMLIRVPAASLQELAQFDAKMQQMGYPYYSYGTKISFDPEQAYPRFKFDAIRPLSDEEAEQILRVRDDPAVARILSGSNDFGVTQEGKVWTENQNSPSTGAVFTQSAQPVEPSPKTYTASTLPSVHATVSPQPSPTVTMQPTPNLAGGASTVHTEQIKDTGSTYPSPLQAAPKAAQVSNGQDKQLEASEFEKGLDALMADLLPHTQ